MSAFDTGQWIESHESGAGHEPIAPAELLPHRELPPQGTLRSLAVGEILFEAGQPRCRVYRIQSGAICSFRLRPDGRREVVGFSVAGDLVGLGGLDSHMWSAEAISETRVWCFPPFAADDLVGLDPAIRARLAHAIECELTILRSQQVEAGRHQPLERVASFLVALAQASAREGGEAGLVSDDLQCGFVTEALGLGIDELSGHLAELARRGLVAFCPPHGLRLTDIYALERLADGAGN